MRLPLRHLDFIRGAPGRSQTCDHRLRRAVLYPLSYWRKGGGHFTRLAIVVVRSVGCSLLSKL